MTDVKIIRGANVLIKVGNGADPEVFAVYCSVNAARGIQFSAAVQEDPIPSCTNPAAAPWVARKKTSKSATVTGGGMLNTPDVQGFFDWFNSDESKNCQVYEDVPGEDGGGFWSGAFHLTDFNCSVQGAQQIQDCTLTLVSDGAVTFTPAD